ncbi:MAG: hypothetical protein JNK05_17950 [Myxococcales bacterium]|nr:hypothetical protein [Myxococcales bacterium]
MHELVSSLWARAAFDEVDAALREFVAAAAYVVTEPCGALYVRLQSLRALLRAARGGDLDPAVASIEHAGVLDSVGVARIAAARAIIALRAGDRTAAVALLHKLDEVHIALPVERAFYRSLSAMAHAGSPTDVYRAPTPPKRGEFCRAWVEGLLPSASDFVDESPRESHADRPWARDPDVDAEHVPVVAFSEAPARRRTLAGALIVCAVGFYLAIEGYLPAQAAPYVLTVSGAVLAVLVMLASLASTRDQAAFAKLAQASRLATLGRDGPLRELVSSLAQTTSREFAVSAALVGAVRALDDGRLDEASRLLDVSNEHAARVSIGRAAPSYALSAYSAFLRAEIAAARADEVEAERWLASGLMRDRGFDSAPRAAKYSVRLWTALALARREHAIEIARTCDAFTLTSRRTDLARDALLSLGDPSARARVLERIDAWPSMKSFLSNVCPWLLDELRQQPATHVRVDATPDRLPESQPAESRSADDASGGAHGRGGSTP